MSFIKSFLRPSVDPSTPQFSDWFKVMIFLKMSLVYKSNNLWGTSCLNNLGIVHVIYYFSDINECAAQPCSLLFECVDRINGVSCKLVVWKLIVIGLAVLMLLGGCTVLLCFLKKKRHKTKNGLLLPYCVLVCL